MWSVTNDQPLQKGKPIGEGETGKPDLQNLLLNRMGVRMKTLLFIFGSMFFVITLFSLHFRFWPELLLMGGSGFVMGVAVGLSIRKGNKHEIPSN